eukprot:Ihof_evm2s495 gene=Ihof_evmTU2s495
MRLTRRLCLVLLSCLLGQGYATNFDDMIAEARSALREGNYEAAVEKVSGIIDLDPNHFVAFDLRSTVYQAVGRTRNALQDLDKATAINPKLTRAWLKKSQLELKLGRFDDAEKSLSHLAESPEAASLKQNILEAREHKTQGMHLYQKKDHAGAVHLLTQAITHANEDPDIRTLRAKANEILGNLAEAIGDYTRATKMSNDDTDGFLQLSLLYHKNGEPGSSLVQIRSCLKLDPEHKECFDHYKRVKKLSAQVDAATKALEEQRYDDAIEKINIVLEKSKDSMPLQQEMTKKLCTSHLQLKHGTEALKECSSALKLVGQDADLLCDKAEALILLGEFDAAITSYQEALNIQEDHSRAKEGVDKAQKLKKQASKRDYYKILGVPRNADKKQINKAYRKMVLEWHPDKYDGDDKSMAQKKFMDLSDAKDVLMDP